MYLNYTVHKQRSQNTTHLTDEGMSHVFTNLSSVRLKFNSIIVMKFWKYTTIVQCPVIFVVVIIIINATVIVLFFLFWKLVGFGISSKLWDYPFGTFPDKLVKAA